MGKFIIKRTPTGFKFDLKATNGEVVATSEVYTTKAACMKGIHSIIASAPTAPCADLTRDETATNPKFELFQDKTGHFRFRLLARNGKIIAVSENYSAKAGCLNGIESVKINAGDAGIMEE